MNEIQALHMELIRRIHMNLLDGKQVAHDLVENQDLWVSAVAWSLDSFITLRDIQHNDNNSDTIYIIAVPGKEVELEALANKWNADCVNFLEKSECQTLLGTSRHLKLLRCWWD